MNGASGGLPRDQKAPVPTWIEEYELRRCVVCGARYPSFGFGPPLTRPGAGVWACSAHRHEVAARFAKLSAPPGIEAPQKTLFDP